MEGEGRGVAGLVLVQRFHLGVHGSHEGGEPCGERGRRLRVKERRCEAVKEATGERVEFGDVEGEEG